MATKYLKNNKGLVRAVTTDNLQLEKPLANENYDVNVFNRNMDKIDSSIKDVKGKIEGLELVASNVKMKDGTTVEDTVSANKTSILDIQNNNGNLSNLNTTNKSNIVSAINEVFQSANNGKSTIATSVGSPLLATDTFSAMGTKINTLTSTLKTNLTNKGVTPGTRDTLSTLINKVSNIKSYPNRVTVGTNHTIYSDTTSYLGTTTNTYNEVTSFNGFVIPGGYRLSVYGGKRANTTHTSKMKIEQKRNGVVVDTKETGFSTTTQTAFVFDFQNIELGDVIHFSLMYSCCSNITFQCQLIL